MTSVDEVLVLTGATVLSPHRDDSTGDTVAITGEVISAVGSYREVTAALAGRRHRVVDLGGGCLLPGFVDPHTHLLATGETLMGVDASYPATRSIAELVARVGEAALRQPHGTWIRGSGMDHAKYPEGRLPTAADLDEVSPHHPVIVFHKSGHSAVVNSVALRMAGDAVRTDPPGGAFARDQAGRATGYCSDTALDLVFPRALDIGCHGPNFHFAAPAEDLQHALDVATDAYLAAGVTTACDPQVTRREMAAYLAAHRAGRLRIRLVAMPLSNHLEGFREVGVTGPLGDEMFRLGAMKFYCDGALTSGTALFSDGYADGALTEGKLYWSPEQLRDLVGEAMALGWQVGIHAQGDLGIRYALDAIEAGSRRAPNAPRARIEHCGYPTDEGLTRMVDLGVIAVNQPNFLVDSGDDLHRTLGSRVHGLQPLRTELERGVLTVISSDSFVSNYRPLTSIASAMDRTTPSGLEVGPDQRLTFAEALRLQTLAPAAALHLDHLVGSVEPGKRADLLHFTTDLRQLTPEELRAAAPATTFLGGTVAAGAPVEAA